MIVPNLERDEQTKKIKFRKNKIARLIIFFVFAGALGNYSNAQSPVITQTRGVMFTTPGTQDTTLVKNTRTSLQSFYGNTSGLFFDKVNNKWRVWNGSAWVDWTLFNSSSVPTITASNGLTKVGNDIRLGGTQTQNTSINTGTFNTNLSGTSGVFMISKGEQAVTDYSELVLQPGNLTFNYFDASFNNSAFTLSTDFEFVAINDLNLGMGGQLEINGDPGTNGQILTSRGNAATPLWQTPATITASNGLTKVGNDIRLGGNGLSNTVVDFGVFGFEISGGNGSTILLDETLGDIIVASGNDLELIPGDQLKITLNSDIAINGTSGSVGTFLGSNGAGISPTWKSAIGGTIANGQVGYGSGINTLTSEAGFEYNAGTNTMSVGRGVFSPAGALTGLNIGTIVGADPVGLVDGDFWLSDNVNDFYKGRIAGSTYNFAVFDGSVSSSQIPFFGTDLKLNAEAGFEYNAGTNLLSVTNATINTNLTVSSLTNTRIPVISTAGLIIDDAGLIYNTTVDELTIGTGTTKIYLSSATNSISTTDNELNIIPGTTSGATGHNLNLTSGQTTAGAGGDLNLKASSGTTQNGNIVLDVSTGASTDGFIVFRNVPTVNPCGSAPSGTVWSNAGILSICP